METREPWLDQHLADRDPVARRHFVHLVTGIIEQPSLLIRASAAASPVQAAPESNDTQVQRSIRATPLTLETVYYPFLMQILAALPGDHAFIVRRCSYTMVWKMQRAVGVAVGRLAVSARSQRLAHIQRTHN